MKLYIKILLFLSLVVLSTGAVYAGGYVTTVGETGSEAPLVMFWNLENFFDFIDDGGGESDTEFSPEGQRRWSRSRFYAKCEGVAKTILWSADHYGRAADIIGFAEVENAFVLRSLVSNTLLRKLDYGIVHYDSEDRRGIDVALLYRKSVFELLSSQAVRLRDDKGESLPTRDILLVELKHQADGDIYYCMVNHHPSKYGGAKLSRGQKELAMRSLKNICDSLLNFNGFKEKDAAAGYDKGRKTAKIIAMGDFNDTPDSELFGILDGRMHNLGNDLHEAGEGTIKYKGKWEMIDMFLVNEELAGKAAMEIVDAPHLLVKDGGHVGDKPFRTYSGPRHIGGISDHLPVVLVFNRNPRR